MTSYTEEELIQFEKNLNEFKKNEKIFERYGYDIMMYICEKGYDKLLEFLLNNNKYNYTINSQCDNFHMTPLMFAIENNNYNCVKLLINDPHINLYLKDIWNNDIYHYARESNNIQIKKILSV